MPAGPETTSAARRGDVGPRLAALVGPVFPARLLLFLISTVSAVFRGHLGKVELSRSLVRADGLPNPLLPGVRLEDRLEPCGRADLSNLEKEALAGAILLDLT